MKKNKVIILGSIIVGVLVVTLGLTYAAISFNRTGGTSQLVLGDIYMHYNETNSISLEGAMPGDDYNIGNPNSYFEFTINGKNTYEKKDIWYDIIVTRGELPSGKIEEYRIPDEYLKFRLVEVVNGEEQEIFTNKTYNHITNRKIHIDTISKNTTSEYNKTYRLYMTISSNLEIGNTIDALYTPETWQEAFASIKVNVTGDFNEKQMPGTMARLASNYMFWEENITNVKENIKEVNFLELTNEEIDTRYNAASIKSDVTTVEEYPIKVWLETKADDSTKYIMYVASSDKIYLPSESNYMFTGFSNLEIIKFDNLDTSYATNISSFFSNCTSLTYLDISSFNTSQIIKMNNLFYNCKKLEKIIGLNDLDTSNVTSMFGLFVDCASLKTLDLSNFDTSNATDIWNMFNGCSNLTEIIGIEKFDTSNVTDLEGLFNDCSSLISLDLSGWDTSKVIGVYRTFNNCKSLTYLDLSTWDMSKVKDSHTTFQYVTKATEIKLPSNLKVIDDFMFNHNYAAIGDTFTISASVEKIGKTHMWYGYGKTFKEFIVEDGNKNFKTIDGILYTMDGTRLISVPTHKTFTNRTFEISEGVTFIGESSFGLNKNIDTLILPNSYVITRYIGKSNASYNSRNVNYGNSLSIGIYYRTNISRYEVKTDNPNYITVDGCIYSKDGSELIAVPWQYNGALSIKEGTTKIGQEAFWTQGASSSEATKLTSVHIPASVTAIESAQITALNKLVGRISITIDEANPNYTISAGKIVSK